jgi:predicted ArsR family transcriptional regulator
MKSLKEIEKMQHRDNVKYEAAKKIAAILDEAHREAGGSADDWDETLEEIQQIVFGD